VKIRRVLANNHRKAFEVFVGRRTLAYPYAKCDPLPSAENPVQRVAVDRELASEACGFTLASGESGSVHVEQVLEYHRDPSLVREQILYSLTVEARDQIARTPLPKREIVRRLGTSASQLYRLLDQTNYRKSIDQMIVLLRALDCDVVVTVRPGKLTTDCSLHPNRTVGRAARRAVAG
jgi:hypothetical protein